MSVQDCLPLLARVSVPVIDSPVPRFSNCIGRMETKDIVVKGARVHNLKNVDLVLPKNHLICFTGVSGSGKSSLAFDTLYAEGQRRYVASLSAYARQFLGQMEKPDVDTISGLAPTISIAQKSAGHNPRSTVGTITEIQDYLRVLFARVGTPHCIKCGQEIGAQTRDQIAARIRALPTGTRINILTQVVQERKGEYTDLFDELRKTGYLRVRVDGHIYNLSEAPQLDRYSRHNIEVVVDRLAIKPSAASRLDEAVDNALRMGEGSLIVARDGEKDWLLSAKFDCPACGISYQEPTPQMFSFNNPQGMCTDCGGLGNKVIMSEKLMVPDSALSINKGAVEPLGDVSSNRWRLHLYKGAAKHLGFTMDTPWKKLARKQKDGFLYGLGDDKLTFTYTNQRGYSWAHDDPYDGAMKHLEDRFHSGPDRARRELKKYMRSQQCPTCHGARLKPQALSITIQGKSLPELTATSIEETSSFFSELDLTETQQLIAEDALKEIRNRLKLLVDIGLGYLSLSRGAHTLAGGEAQRIKLASQIGSGLVGVLYILDEPSIGLHFRDNKRLLSTLKKLRDIGNTVVVVEHDEETMLESDILVDFGPGAGERGGHLVISGTPDEIAGCAESATGNYLRGTEQIEVPASRREPNGQWLEVEGAQHNNLKDVTARIPLGVFNCVTGVSGSGKSSLVNDILFKELDRKLHRAKVEPGLHKRIDGGEHLDKVIRIDQKPIGRTPRSNPATYTDLFTPLRTLFSKLPEARVRGYKPGRFSFNVKGGRCEACEGNGAHLVEMEFLSDIWVKCEVCDGRRFNRETLSIKFKEKSIADVLDMEVEAAVRFFENVPPIARVLKVLNDVGLGYIKLGQPAPTLSGGEAQRVKLAKELWRRSTGRTLYLLDEPTTGLHFADVQKLLNILHAFTAQGNTVVVIEHNMEVIKTADYILDLGPEGGEEGGEIVAVGTPEELAAKDDTHTGHILRKVLRPRPRRPGKAKKPKSARNGKKNGWIDEIRIIGARQHNLKGMDVRIPRDQMTVISGVSGSGKSSLAFDTIYAEGQRRYVESLSAYARQFLEQMQKPKVERITGLSPAIAIEQKSPSKNPRSTVGTVTEVYDYVRALFATVGVQHCPVCNVPVGAQTSQQIVDRILEMPEGQRILLLAPLEDGRHEGWEALLKRARQDGFARARIDGTIFELAGQIELERRHRHRVELVVDRLKVLARDRSRLNESVERALELSGGEVIVHLPDEEEDRRYSRRYSCPSCSRSFEPLSPQSFSFNHHDGMCTICEGMGIGEGLQRDFVVSDRGLSVRQGAIDFWGPIEDPYFARMLEAAGLVLGFDIDTPFGDLTPAARRGLLYGSVDQRVQPDDRFHVRYRGILPTIDEFARSSSRYKKMMAEVPCSACEGSRLKPESRAVFLAGVGVGDLVAQPIGEVHRFFEEFDLSLREAEVAGELLQEIRTRLGFLKKVGLDYVSLDRRAATLSGGEAQRIRLASQIGSGLTGVLYLLDEPTIGLHPRDNRRLLEALQDLKRLGNTVVVVEHDRDTLEDADHVIDLGPGAGAEGGRLVAAGAPDKLRRAKNSITGAYLGGKFHIPAPPNRRRGNETSLQVIGARQNNLKNIDVDFPLGLMLCVTGVSGSGKSSLVEEILHNALANELHRAERTVGDHDQILGLENIDKVINIDQSPIGHSPRSTPATVMGVFDLVRQLYSEIPEAKVRGYGPGRFSFNKPGGRCEACSGLGWKCIEMHFLPDVWVQCDACHGKRYTSDILQIRFKGYNISDVLNMTVEKNLGLFENIPRISHSLQTMHDVGLGYMSLGQSSTTLSGGEAQRLKLAAELARPSTGQTLYLLDEPTTGLHIADIEKLLTVMHRLVDKGNTVVVVEHNMEVIKTVDHIIDLGPEGGEGGGRIVAAGTPEQVAKVKKSHTGKILAEVL